jgi:hypothetical protein
VFGGHSGDDTDVVEPVGELVVGGDLIQVGAGDRLSGMPRSAAIAPAVTA